MTILVADDNPGIRRFFSRLIGDKHKLLTASSGEGLLELWKSNKCRVIISDIGMPGKLNGIQACKIIRDADPTIRIILMTGDPQERLYAKSKGFKTVLSKPFSFKDILRHLRLKFNALCTSVV